MSYTSHFITPAMLNARRTNLYDNSGEEGGTAPPSQATIRKAYFSNSERRYIGPLKTFDELTYPSAEEVYLLSLDKAPEALEEPELSDLVEAEAKTPSKEQAALKEAPVLVTNYDATHMSHRDGEYVPKLLKSLDYFDLDERARIPKNSKRKKLTSKESIRGKF